MRRLALIVSLIAPAALAGCGGDDTIQITGGKGEVTEEQKAIGQAADQRVNDAERANTPTRESLKKR